MRGLSRLAHRLAGPVDVLHAGRARQPGDGRLLDALGDLAHGLEVAVRGDREARLDDVDPHLVEEVGDLDLLLQRHGGAGALLAVAQRGVEDQDAVLVGPGARLNGHRSRSFSAPLVGALRGSEPEWRPLSAQACARPALRGG